jgi:hypothetical protein
MEFYALSMFILRVGVHSPQKLDTFIENPVNLAASFMGGCTILLLCALKDRNSQRWQTASKIIGIMLNTFVMIAMQSRGALVGFSSSIVVFAIQKMRHLLIAILCIGILVGLCHALLPGLAQRFDMQNLAKDPRIAFI